MSIPLLKYFQRTKQPIINRYPSIFGVGGSIPSNRNTTGFLEAYNSIGWWHAVNFRIALGLSEVKWTLFDVSNRDKPKQIYTHKILDLLHLVNPFQTSNEFIALDSIYMESIGESFWAINFNALGEPAEMVLPYPQKMSVVPDRVFPFVKGYVYDTGANAIPFEVNEIIHFKFPNPLNQYRGLGQAQAIGINLDAQENADKWINQFFYNSARPDGVIQFDYNLSDEQFAKLQKQWNEKYKGVSKAHQVALLEGGGKYIQIQNTVKDMDFPNLQLKNRDIILGVEGMPLSVMGISENVNKANAEAGDYTFARWIVKPRLDWKTAKLQEQLIPKFRNSQNLKLGFEEVVPETIDQKKELAESGMRAGYLTINEARKLRGLDPLPNGDVLLVPLNLIPTDIKKPMNPPPAPSPAPVSAPPEEEPKEEIPEELEQESYKGGEGSGNFGHEGRPGEVGGSGEGGGGEGGDGEDGEGGLTGGKWTASLNDKENGALKSWAGSEYLAVRDYQTKGKGSEETAATIKSMETACAKDGAYEGTLYRGIRNVDSKSYAKIESADTIEWKSFTSTTTDPQIAAKFARHNFKGERVMFRIDAKSGVDLRPLGAKDSEILQSKGSKFKVLGKSMKTYSYGGSTFKALEVHLKEQ